MSAITLAHVSPWHLQDFASLHQVHNERAERSEVGNQGVVSAWAGELRLDMLHRIDRKKVGEVESENTGA